MRFDRYDIFARVIPAVLSAVPFFVLHFYLLSPVLGVFWGQLLGLRIVSDVTFVLALLYLSLQLNRIISKEIFEKRIYRDGLLFPTTQLLLHLDSYFSPEYTSKIHNKIKTDFGIIIPSKENEIENEDNSRKILSEATSLIRGKVGKGNLVGQHNLEYGFIRNFSGGCVVATTISLLNVLVFQWGYTNQTALLISIFSFFFYFLLSLFARKLIDSVGRSYAKVLLQEYMMISN